MFFISNDRNESAKECRNKEAFICSKAGDDSTQQNYMHNVSSYSFSFMGLILFTCGVQDDTEV